MTCVSRTCPLLGTSARGVRRSEIISASARLSSTRRAVSDSVGRIVRRPRPLSRLGRSVLRHGSVVIAMRFHIVLCSSQQSCETNGCEVRLHSR